MFYSFTWNNTDHIKRNTLIAEIEDDGINVIDVDSHILALKASWVSKIIDTNDSWVALGKDYFNILSNFDIIRLKFNKVDTFLIMETLPTFYQGCLSKTTRQTNFVESSYKGKSKLYILGSV